MEVLVFGHGGTPMVVFPTSGGRFYEFEDHGMVAALGDKIEAGQLRLFCVDSVDAESWYNRGCSPRQRILRHMQFEQYILDELVPSMRSGCCPQDQDHDQDWNQSVTALGCSLGGYHAVNIALRHPDVFTRALSFSGAFDLSSFLDGYSDRDCYLHLPTYYLPNLSDPWFLQRYRRNRLLLATGWDDQCLSQNQQLDGILTEKEIPHQLHVWDVENAHDWPTWKRMVEEYL